MLKFQQRSVKLKLALILLGFALIPSSTVGIVSFLFSKNLSARYALNVESLATETLDQLENVFLESSKTLDTLSKKSEFSDVSGALAGVELIALSELLAEETLIHKEFSLLLVTDANRFILSSQTPGSSLIGKQLEDSPEYQQALKSSISQSGFQTINLTNQPLHGFWTHAPLYSAWDKTTPIGVLSGFYGLEPIQHLVRGVLIEGNKQDRLRYVEVLRADGLLMVGPEFITQQQEPLSYNRLEKAPSLASLKNSTQLRGTIHQVVENWGEGLEGQKQVVGFARNPEKGLLVLVYVDESIVFRQIETLRKFITIFMAVVVVGCVGCVLPISRIFTGPLFRLLEAVKLVSAGDLSHEVAVVSKDEFGELTKAFNKMTRDLKHSYDHLEELVESRTKELKMSNERLQEEIGERRRVEEELRKQNEYLAALHETTLALMNRLELAGLLEILITRAGTLLNTSHGFIYLIESEKTEAVLRVGVGIYTKYVDYRIKFGEGVSGRVWQSGQPLAINGYQTWSGRLSGFSDEIVQAVVAVPLKSGPQVVGVIGLAYLERDQEFGDNEIMLLSRFAELASIALDNAQLYTSAQQELIERRRAEKALKEKNDELETTLQQLKDMQAQLVTQEKLASLGALTAGIAHEIKNPLNFVNNFAELSTELTTELRKEFEQQKDRFDSQTLENIEDIIHTLGQNISKINEHGKRADSIIRNMLLHSRGGVSEKQPTDINILLAEYVNLAYHGMRAEDPSFNVTIKKDYDLSIGLVEVVPQNMSRVFLNIVNNACYAVHQKRKKLGEGFFPTLWIKTKNLRDHIEIRIRDNGNGIPQNLVDKIFNPFFTTKPTGQGTGLGLSISYDIVVREHKGELRVETEEGNYTEFIIGLPKKTTYQ